jgi:rsbT co-antagonist protein RsbR
MTIERPKINVSGLDFEWDRESGVMRVQGNPVVCMWIESTMAGFMSGLQKLVGTERFNIALEGAGAESISSEAVFVGKYEEPLAGLQELGRLAEFTGQGRWEIVSIDREKKEARFRARNHWEAQYQKALGVCWGSSVLAGKLAGHCSKIFGTTCRAEQTAFVAKGDAYDEFFVRPSDESIEAEFHSLTSADTATKADLTAALETLQKEMTERKQAEATSAELASALENLRKEVQQRERVEQELRAKLMIIRRQEEAIRAMSTPILQLWEGVLTMPVVGLMDSMRAAQMMETLLDAIAKTHVRVTILDLTGVDVIDTSAANHILRLVRGAGLMGTRCFISGISPGMANTIVGLGLDLSELLTFNTLEAALRFAIQEIEEGDGD